jgi:hypothetical protein
MAIERIKSVTLAVLRIVPGTVYYVKIVSPIKVGEKIDDKKEPAEICEVIDMETGEHRTLVTSTVMRKELTKAYPADAYVGKFFELSQSRREGKNYNDVSLCEIGDPSTHFEEERTKRAAAIAAAEAAAKAAAKAAEDVKKGKTAAPAKS